MHRMIFMGARYGNVRKFENTRMFIKSSNFAFETDEVFLSMPRMRFIGTESL